VKLPKGGLESICQKLREGPRDFSRRELPGMSVSTIESFIGVVD
jgi:hypothetical protein